MANDNMALSNVMVMEILIKYHKQWPILLFNGEMCNNQSNV